MKYILASIVLILLSSCGTAFVSRARNNSNIREIVEFRNYLDSINIPKGFSEPIIITYNDADTVMKAFFKKYKVRCLRVTACRSCSYPSEPFGCPAADPFKNCGNLIELDYAHVPILGNTHTIYFDYSTDGLQLKEEWSKKGKLADRIFAF